MFVYMFAFVQLGIQVCMYVYIYMPLSETRVPATIRNVCKAKSILYNSDQMQNLVDLTNNSSMYVCVYACRCKEGFSATQHQGRFT